MVFYNFPSFFSSIAGVLSCVCGGFIAFYQQIASPVMHDVTVTSSDNLGRDDQLQLINADRTCFDGGEIVFVGKVGAYRHEVNVVVTGMTKNGYKVYRVCFRH